MPKKIITISAKKPSDDSHLQQRGEPSAAKPSAKFDIIRIVTEEAKKTMEVAPQTSKAKYRPLLHACFDYHLRVKLLPGHTEPPIAIDVICGSLLNSGCHPSCFREPGTDNKYELSTPSQRQFII